MQLFLLPFLGKAHSFTVSVRASPGQHSSHRLSTLRKTSGIAKSVGEVTCTFPGATPGGKSTAQHNHLKLRREHECSSPFGLGLH